MSTDTKIMHFTLAIHMLLKKWLTDYIQLPREEKHDFISPKSVFTIKLIFKSLFLSVNVLTGRKNILTHNTCMKL
jgi:hypothetical protein